MEADDTEVIKRLVESGFGYSILPQYALGGRGHRFEKLRIPGRRLARQQALAMPKTEYPRALTVKVANFLQATLGERSPSVLQPRDSMNAGRLIP
jgi:DNA-binding transcriptional LysR family regulator